MKKRIYSLLLILILVVTTCFSGYSNVSAAETEGSKKTVTVYFTLSEDGKFVTGNDDNETVLCHVPVTISYFDLAEYGLEDYYRYEADSFEDGGRYNSDKIVEQPTLLHLFIKMLEKYYLPNGEKFIPNDSTQDAMSISGSATSLYMTRFWGHDENLMYYVNHSYPLQAAGWGSTSDYILLEDGMEIDVAMFSDWDFYHTGAFAYFTSESTNSVDSGIYNIKTNENINLTMRGTATNAANDGSSTFVGEKMPGEDVVYCKQYQAVADYNNDNWKRFGTTDDNGQINLSFDKPGTYYVSSTSLYENYNLSSGNACVAPPIAVINVSDDSGEVTETSTEKDTGETGTTPQESTGSQETNTETGTKNPDVTTENVEDYTGKIIKNIEISNGVSDNALKYSLDSQFQNNRNEYNITILDYENSVCVRAALDNSGINDAEIVVNYTDINGENRVVSIVGDDELGKKLNRIIETGAGGNQFTITATYKNKKENYTFNIIRKLSLKNLSVKSRDNDIDLQPQFDQNTNEYEINIPESLKEITLTAVPYMKNQYKVYINGKETESGNDYTVSTENNVEIKLEKDGCESNLYILKINKTKLVSVDFELTKESVLQVKNSNKETIVSEKVTEDKYTLENLLQGEEYSYVITKNGYVSKNGTFKAGEVSSINGILREAQNNETINKNIKSQWSNFRGNSDNNAVTDSLTATDYKNSMLYWAKKVGKGYGSGAPSSPILVGEDLVYTTATSVVKINTITGEVIKSGHMIRTSAFNITPPTYGDGMIFVALASGAVQVFNADTLESLWVYEDPLHGQPNSPITYHDGYVYTGFWNGETGVANYVCLSATDENTGNQTESKEATWTYTSKGGFYWAGSYVNDNYLVVGTDDGASADETGNGSLLVLNPLTGKVISKYSDIRGDVRSTITYDKDTDRFYFTSKGGDFCCAKIDSKGNIEEIKKTDLGSASTSTPVIANRRAYVGVKGNEQFGVNSGHHIAVIDLENMSIAYSLLTRGYPQTSGLATTGYEQQDGYTYVYFIDNYEPGKVRVLKDKPGQSSAIITRDSEYEDENDYNVLFSPKGEQANYAICSLITDEYGTMYFKNDSAYMMALGSKITKIMVTKKPDKLVYKAGETFDSTGMEVTAFYSNGKTRDITKYVTVENKKLTANMTDIEVSFEHVLYNDELKNYEKFEPLIDTVDITVIDEAGEKQASNVVNKINLIGDNITINSKQAIFNARNAYNSLDSSLEFLVSNYGKLTKAEATFKQVAAKYFSQNPLKTKWDNKLFQTINISWNSLKQADGYLVYKLNSAGKYVEVANITKLNFKDTTAIVGQTYKYKVIPYIKISNSKMGIILGKASAIQAKSKLGKTERVKLSKAKKKYIKIKWKGNKNCSGYVIYKKTGKKFKVVKTVTTNKKITYLDKKVKLNKKYSYKIRGYRIVSGKKIYGDFSAIKSLKIKK